MSFYYFSFRHCDLTALDNTKIDKLWKGFSNDVVAAIIEGKFKKVRICEALCI